MLFHNVPIMTMDQRTEIVEGADAPLLRKWALTSTGRAALAQEADRLERARHPGVVALASVADDHLDLEWAGAETLALARLTRGSAARIVTVLAATIADLHDRGIVHGRIDETHVVIGSDLRPRLCGLRGPEPGRSEPGPADDVADLGLLLERAIGMGADPDVVPEHRWRAWPRSGGRDRALEAVVERATDPDPARRPTARALARSLADLVPDAVIEHREATIEPPSAPPPVPSTPPCPDLTVERSSPEPGPSSEASSPPRPTRVAGARLMTCAPGLPQRSTTTATSIASEPPSRAADTSVEHPPRPRRDRSDPLERRSLSLRLLAVIGLAIAVAAALTLRQPSPHATDPARPTPTRIGGQASIAVDRSAVAAPPKTQATQPNEDDATNPSAATIVAFGGVTYEVGEAGDHIVVADWDCDGTASVGLVRPGTGEVFLFDDWPDAQEVTVRARAQIVGARELIAAPPGQGCRSPEVLLEDGTSVVVAVEAGG